MIKIKPIPLKKYEKNFYSQFGEDGIIEYLKTSLNTRNFEDQCVDVGSWDGQYLSNVRRQIDLGSSALLIEGDISRHSDASKSFENIPRVKTLNFFVNENLPLHKILSDEGISSIFLLLSIDIDGADLDVFESLGSYSPVIVIIEFNPTIPNTVYFRNPLGARVGSSAKAIFESATKFGYSLAHVTQTNLILVKDEFLSKDSYIPLTIDEAIDDQDTVKGIFTGYDGSLHFAGSSQIEFPWHGIAKDANTLELPKIMRNFPDEMKILGKIIFKFYWFKQYWRIALKRRVRKFFGMNKKMEFDF